MAESNRMREMPVNKLMVQMGIPMILSMALQAVYNIVDSAFVGNMKVGSEAALNALTLVLIFSTAVPGFGTEGASGSMTSSSLQEPRIHAQHTIPRKSRYDSLLFVFNKFIIFQLVIIIIKMSI